jgi:phosphoribosylglycinamide formyltransferase-1
LFCFGSGTNAENIIKYFASGVGNSGCRFTNNPTAKVIERAKNNKSSNCIFSKEELIEGKYYKIKSIGPDLIVLAGFFTEIPAKYYVSI